MAARRSFSFFHLLARTIPWKRLFRRDHVELDGSIIPPPQQRWCGRDFKDNQFYVESAEREANRLVQHLGCTEASRILDVGCGQGRLPIGILRVIGELDYTGIDVDRRSIEWCRRYLQRDHPSFKFQHLDLYNERYNRRGMKIDDSFKFELEPCRVDIIYLYSVFSHATEADMRVYLREFSRLLTEGGKIFFTTFVETSVPDVSINPKNHRVHCDGPLHVVQYDKDYLFSMIKDAGFSVTEFLHATETDGQSALYLTKQAQGSAAPRG